MRVTTSGAAVSAACNEACTSDRAKRTANGAPVSSIFINKACAKALLACGASLGALAASTASAAAECASENGIFVVMGTQTSIVANRDCGDVQAGDQTLSVETNAILGGDTALATGDGPAMWTIDNNGNVTGALTGLFNNSLQTGEATTVNNKSDGRITGRDFGINSPGALTLDNAGDITSDTYIAVKTVRGGTITNQEGAVISGGYGAGHTGRTGGGIVNTGELTVANYGEIDGKSVGVTNFAPGDMTLNNETSGEIRGRFAVSNTGRLDLNNSGELNGTQRGVTNASNGHISLRNNADGVITSSIDAIRNDGVLSHLENHGVIGLGEATSSNNPSPFRGVRTTRSAVINNRKGGVIRGQFGLVNSGALTLDNDGIIDGFQGGSTRGANTIGVYTEGVSTPSGGRVSITNGWIDNRSSEITGDTAIVNAGVTESGSLDDAPDIHNYGVIRGSHHFQDSPDTDGPSNTGVINTGDLTLDNHELIEGVGLVRATGVRTESASNTRIVNHAGAVIKGEVTGDLPDKFSLPTELGIGIDNAGDEMFIQNAGAILGTGGPGGGVGVRNTGQSAAITVTNQVSGLIDGTRAGVLNLGEISVFNETGARISSQDTAVVNDVVANSQNSMSLFNAGAIAGNSMGVSNHGSLNFENRGVVNQTSTGIANLGDGRLTLDNSGRIETSAYGVLTDSGDSTIINNRAGGVISGEFGVYSRDGELTELNNWGTITGRTSGVRAERDSTIDNKANAIISGGRNGVGYGENPGSVTLHNAGEISGGLQGVTGSAKTVTITNKANATISGGINGVVYGGNPDNATLYNAGEISGGRNGVIGSAKTATITNVAGGEIVGATSPYGTGSGVYFLGLGEGREDSTLALSNAGTIRGRTGVYAASAGSGSVNHAIITNLAGGTIAGDTNAIESAERLTLVNAGRIDGHVIGGRLNDTVELHQGYEFAGHVDARGGEDTLRFGGIEQFDVSRIGVDSDFRNFERFDKTGDGLLHLDGRYAGDGNFTVSEGELELALSLRAQNTAFEVKDGATLSGWGFIGALTVANGATVSPSGGDIDPDIGWSAVQGDIVFEAGSFFDVQINDTVSDRLTAFGSINIDPAATLRVSATSALTGATTDYIIFRSFGAGGISGEFGTVDDSGLPDLDIELDYTDPTQTRLRYTQAASPSITASAASAPTHSSKEVHPSSLMASLDSAERFTDTLVGRAGAPSGGFTGGAFGFAPGADDRPSGAWWAPIGARVQGAGALPGRNSNAALGDVIFSLENNLANESLAFAPDLTGAFARNSVRDDGLVPGWAAAMGGLVFGVDQDLSEAGLPLTLGFASGFSRSNLDVGGSRADLETWHMGLYAAHRRGPLTISGAAGFARHAYDFSRQVAIGGGALNAVSDAEGASFTFSGEAFYDLAPSVGKTGLSFGPVATFSALSASRNGFVEDGVGVLNLTVEDDAVRQFTTGLGGIVSLPTAEVAGVRFGAQARVVWEHVNGDLAARTTSAIPFADATFITDSAQFSARNRAAVGAGAAFAITDRLNLQTNYDGRFDSRFPDHRFTAGLSWRF